MRIRISFNRGEILRMRAQERRFHLRRELRSAFLMACTIRGEVAQDMIDYEIDRMMDELYLLDKALKRHKRKEPLP